MHYNDAMALAFVDSMQTAAKALSNKQTKVLKTPCSFGLCALSHRRG